jgi:hypothetical protein
MKPILKTLKLKKYAFYETHLAIVNIVLGVDLKPMEIKVLSRFMSLEGDIAKDRFGETARKIVKTDPELTLSAGGLSNYMRAFRKKKVLDKDDNIWPIFFPTSKAQEYGFKLIMIDES